jgi:hypothetical protein
VSLTWWNSSIAPNLWWTRPFSNRRSSKGIRILLDIQATPLRCIMISKLLQSHYASLVLSHALIPHLLVLLSYILIMLGFSLWVAKLCEGHLCECCGFPEDSRSGWRTCF